jgi:chromosomal replication initiation ATPase DnaA
MAGAQVLPARELNAEALDMPACAFAIEDIGDDEPNQARDRALLALFERPGTWLLLTARKPPTEWQSSIGDLKSRFQSLIAFAVWEPDDALLCALVVKHFADRQLDARPAVVARIVTGIERTPEAISRFIARADRKALAEKRAVTERLVLELLESEAHIGSQV